MNKTAIFLYTTIIILLGLWTKGWSEDCSKDDPTQTEMSLCAVDNAKAVEQTEDCIKTTLDLGLCASDDVKKAEQALDAVYSKLIKKISFKGRAKLRAAQSAWIEYRKQQCEFNTLGSVGGSVHPMVLTFCYADLARQQTKTLQRQFECAEGDLSCGGQ